MKETLQSDLSGISVGCEVRSLPVGDFVWVARPLSDISAPSSFKEVVISIVVERKRADDLASSIVDGRFLEQKSRMQKLGFKRIYLFEECTGMRNLHISYETLLQSLINAQLIDGCEAVNFSNGSQCAEYLAALSRTLLSKAVFDLTVYYGDSKPNNPNLDRLWGIPWDEFSFKSKKSPVLSLREEFGRHLLQIHTMTGPKAANILSAYPTPISLVKAFAETRDGDWRKQSLSKQTFRSVNGNLEELVHHMYNTL
uniref:Crossover junction endonuclease MUS81 n=3 Tax=Schistocephalus solidus TaxID=70667 RepID=A0A0X3NMN3_SCHSO